MNGIRRPAAAGMFYPGGAGELRSMAELMLAEAEAEEEEHGRIFGLISPHAGYMYSGATAAKAYAYLKGGIYKKIIILAPSHFEYFPGISVYGGQAYQTPLGAVEIDKELRDKLLNQSDLIFESSKGHGKEHAVETQLPFLQTVLENEFTFVPVVIGDQKREIVFNLADALSEILDEDVLIVVSSDLSHYHDKEEAKFLDDKIAGKIESFDYESLQTSLERGACEACGGGGIAALLKAAANKGKSGIKITGRSDSGDVSGDDSQVVGYLSAVIYS